MYEFIDLDEPSLEEDLPAEAMSYNGVYLEREINGYRTLSVSGRELYAAEAVYEQIGDLDGAIWQGKKYPPRTITVRYRLTAESPQDFREAFNKMNQLLYASEVPIIFADEPDKYFTGTKVSNDEVETGRNSVVGEIEIFCADPFKYSLVPKVVHAAAGEDGGLYAEFRNEGSYPALLDYEITMNAGDDDILIKHDEGTMKFGGELQAAGKAILLDFADLMEAGQDTSNTWSHPTYGNCYTADYEPSRGYVTIKTGGPYTYNGREQIYAWYGGKARQGYSFSDAYSPARSGYGDTYAGLAMKTFTLPRAVANWQCDLSLAYEEDDYRYNYLMEVFFLDENQKEVVTFRYTRHSSYDTTVHRKYDGFAVWVRGTTAMNIYPSATYEWNEHFNGTLRILKNGNTVTTKWGNDYASALDAYIDGMDIKYVRVTMGFPRYKTDRNDYWHITEWRGPNLMAYYGFELSDLDAEAETTTKKRYSAGDVIKLTGKDGTVKVNGVSKPAEEVIGTTWFRAPYGKNRIQFRFSEDCETLPDVKVTVQQRWL